MIFCVYCLPGSARHISYNTGKKMVKWSEEEIVENIFKKYKSKKISCLLHWCEEEKAITANCLKMFEKRLFKS